MWVNPGEESEEKGDLESPARGLWAGVSCPGVVTVGGDNSRNWTHDSHCAVTPAVTVTVTAEEVNNPTQRGKQPWRA